MKDVDRHIRCPTFLLQWYIHLSVCLLACPYVCLSVKLCVCVSESIEFLCVCIGVNWVSIMGLILWKLNIFNYRNHNHVIIYSAMANNELECYTLVFIWVINTLRIITEISLTRFFLWTATPKSQFLALHHSKRVLSLTDHILVMLDYWGSGKRGSITFGSFAIGGRHLAIVHIHASVCLYQAIGWIRFQIQVFIFLFATKSMASQIGYNWIFLNIKKLIFQY